MEGRSVRAALIVCLILGMLVTESIAGFSPIAYAKCFAICSLKTRKFPLCAVKCIVIALRPSFGGGWGSGGKKEACQEKVVEKCMSAGKSKEDCANEAEQQCKNETALAESDPRDLCQYGCATNMCTKISTAQNPAAAKVAECVNNCGMMCAKN